MKTYYIGIDCVVENGQIVIPLEKLKPTGVKEEGQHLQVFIEATPSCSICGENNKELEPLGDSVICQTCLDEIKQN